jgi:spore coat protein A
MRHVVVASALLAPLLLAGAALADTVNLSAARDATIFEDNTDFANGAGDHMHIGRNNATASLRRALIQFDVAASIPAGATIDAASLTLYVSQASGEAPHPAALHRLLAPWAEGTSDPDGGEGGGVLAGIGDATWSHRVWDATMWTTPGGDFAAQPSATTMVGFIGASAVWSGAGLVADVQAWLDDPASNRGWAIVTGVTSGAMTRRFDSRTNPTVAQRPRLFVDFTPATPSGACCAIDGTCSTVDAPGTACAGAYQGTGTDCGSVACPQPPGACCFADASGTCDYVPPDACAEQGGTFTDSFVACEEDVCPVVPTAFLDPLPILPVAEPVSRAPGQPAIYEMSMRETFQELHSELPSTRVWGFDDGTSGPITPGPVFDVQSGDPIEVVWRNDLRDERGALRTEHVLPLDMCLMGAMEPQPRTVIHFHGGHVASASDGNPMMTFLPGEEDTYEYPNAQRAATLWYHDHAMGTTRLNTYMGLAGPYVIRDAEEQALDLPSGADEIPLVLQDRTVGADGQLRYPAMWMEHHFGNLALVNGRVWPRLEVPQGKVRFRIVNAAGSRTWRLALSNGASIVQIGSDGGLLAAPVVRPAILIQPGERADVVIDFAPYPAGTQIVLQNDAPTPYPAGGMDHPLPQVMRFDVTGTPGHTAPIPDVLSVIPPIDEAEAEVTRELVLRKEADDCTGGKWQINGLGMMDPVTESPTLGTSEIWQFFNESGVSHPMHMHLVMFRVLDRQPFTLVDGEHVPSGPVVLPPPEEQGWKDTVRVDPFTRVRVIARFEDYTGEFMYHCHIIEHEDNDMMRPFETVTTCGDGALGMPDEECDDGNDLDGDGCSATCMIEAPPGTGGGGGAGGAPGEGGGGATSASGSGGGDGGAGGTSPTGGPGSGGASGQAGGATAGSGAAAGQGTTTGGGGEGGAGDGAAADGDTCYCAAVGAGTSGSRAPWAPAALAAAAVARRKRRA